MERLDSVPNVLTFFDLESAKDIAPLISGMNNPSFTASSEDQHGFMVKFLL